MNKILLILITLMLILPLSFGSDRLPDQVPDFVRDKLEERFNEIEQRKYKLFEKHKSLINSSQEQRDYLFRQDVKEEVNKDFRNLLVEKQEGKAYNIYGGVSRSDIDNSSVVISDRLIRVQDYDEELNEQFDVVLFTGDHLKEYNIYHSKDYNSYDDVKKHGEYLKTVYSYNGYIFYNTDQFSTQIASFFSSYSISGTESLFFDLTDFYNDINQIDLTITDNDNNNIVLECVGLCGNEEETFTHEGVDYRVYVQAVSGGDRELEITGRDENRDHNVAVTSSSDGTAGTSASDSFQLLTSPENEPPSQIASIAPISLIGSEDEIRILDNYFNNFDEVTLTFNADLSTQVLNAQRITGVGDLNSYNGDEVYVWLDYRAGSNDFLLRVFGQDEDYNEDFDLEICNDGQCITESFNVDIQEESIDPPSQIASISDLDLVGFGTGTRTVGDYFVDWEDVTVTFASDGANRVLSSSIGGGDDIYQGNDIEVILSSSGSDVDINIIGTDKNYNEDFTVEVYNSEGSVSDTFNVNVDEDTSGNGNGNGEENGVTDEDLRSGIQAYYTFDENTGTVAGDSTTNENDLNIEGNPDWVSGKIGSALEFDDASKHIVIPSSFDTYFLSTTSEIMLNMWVKVDDSNDINGIYNFNHPSDGNQRQTLAFRENLDVLRLDRSGSVNNFPIPSQLKSEINGNFAMVTMIKRGNNYRFKINDFSLGEITNTGSVSISATDRAFGKSWITSNSLNGVMDELSIFDISSMSDEEVNDIVQELYNRQSQGLSGAQYDFTSETIDPVNQIASIGNIELANDNNQIISMNDFFENYDEITLTYQDEDLQQTISLNTQFDGSSDSSDGDFNVELTPTSNNILLDITAKNRDVNPTEFTIEAINEVSSETTTFDVSSTTSTEPPEFIGTIGDISINGFSRAITSISDFAQNYNEIRFSFPLPDQQVTETIIVDNIISSESYDDELNLGVILSRIIGEVDNLQLYGRNRDYNEDVTVQIVNDEGVESQTFNLDIKQLPPPSTINGLNFPDTIEQRKEDPNPLIFNDLMDEEKLDEINNVNVTFYSDGEVRNLYLDELGGEIYGSIEDNSELLLSLQKESLFGNVQWALFSNAFGEWEYNDKPVEVIITYNDESSDEFTINFVEDETVGNGDENGIGNGNGNGIDTGDSPSWFPQPPEGERVFWAIAILSLVVGLVAFSGFYTKSSFLVTTTFGVIAFTTLFLLLIVIGWIPIWVGVMTVIIASMWLASKIWSGMSGGGV